MSTVMTGQALDVSGTPQVPFGRLTAVEVRKMADTRAGAWLLGIVAVITLLIVVLVFAVADADDRTFLNFMGATATPQGFVLPVLGILLVTSEWGQRTTLTTFALEPSRAKVIWAKVAAALVLGAVAIVIAVAIAALAALFGGAADPWHHVGVDDPGKFAILQISGILAGLAFGLIFLNSAAAIVTYFVLPIAFSIVANLWDPLRDIAAWVDTGTAQQPLFMGASLTGEQWGQLATATTIWVVLPFVLGLVRVMRSELK